MEQCNASVVSWKASALHRVTPSLELGTVCTVYKSADREWFVLTSEDEKWSNKGTAQCCDCKVWEKG